MFAALSSPTLFTCGWVHPLLRFLFSLEYVFVLNPLCMRTCSTPSLRFRSSSRHQSSESTCGEFPSSHVVPLSVFRTLSTVCSSFDLLDLFHSKATSKIRFPRAFPTIKPPQLVAALCPHCISKVRLLRSYPHSADFPRRTSKALLLIAIRYNH